jgi:glycosyltransferase involved in cell wall biosynthesis
MRWHLVTGEYPPQIGGVGDYTRAVATALSGAGDDVHVWCPGSSGDSVEHGVHVHRSAGSWSRTDRDRLSSQLHAAGDGTVVVQWVPHAFGQRSLNLGFCGWVRRLAGAGMDVDVMVHEPFLSFSGGSWRQPAAAAVHRVMVALLLSRARRVWVSIPAWADRLKPWAGGRAVPLAWLPVPSNIPVVDNDETVAGLRATLAPEGMPLVGHFGTYGGATVSLLEPALTEILRRRPDIAIVLIGRDSEAFRTRLLRHDATAATRVSATGAIDHADVSMHLQACDVLLQPFIDGASSRRGTLMAGLAHGCPVVSTVGRLSEPLWTEQDGRALRVVEAGDHHALAEAVVGLLDDPHGRRALGRAARALYASRFSLDHVVTALRAPTGSLR